MIRDRLRFPYAPGTPPESSLPALIYGLQVGKPFARRLTRNERLAISIAWARPRRHLVLSSRDLDRDQLAQAWRKLRQRIARARRMPDRLIYFAVPARAPEAGGYHLHCLLWGGYLHRPVLTGQAKDVGFGEALRIIEIDTTPHDRLTVASYVLGQCEPVFGSAARHEPVERGKRYFLSPQDATLRSEQPKLLLALDRARDQQLSDVELVRACPLFSSSNSSPYRSYSATSPASEEVA